MSDFSQPKSQVPKIASRGGYLPQEAMLEITRQSGSLSIGIPDEHLLQENRIALVPASVATLVAHGHRILIEQGSGLRTGYADHYYSEAGAIIAHSTRQVYEQSDIILKTAPPDTEEFHWMRPDHILVSPLPWPIVNEQYLHSMKSKRLIALALEYIQNEEGAYPLLRVMGEIVGSCVMTIAANLMTKNNHGKGVLLGGVSGVPPTRVVIIGAGAVAESAARVALGMGVELRIFDNDVMKLMRLQNHISQRVNTSTLNPFQLKKELLRADLVISALHSDSGRSPVIVTEETVHKMKEGSIIIDVSIDQGGCFATSKLTSHDNPTYTVEGVTHYCVPNIASQVPRTASIAVSNILTPILIQAGNCGGIEYLIRNFPNIRQGVYAYKGNITNPYLANHFGLKYTDLDLMMMSGI